MLQLSLLLTAVVLPRVLPRGLMTAVVLPAGCLTAGTAVDGLPHVVGGRCGGCGGGWRGAGCGVGA
jgi:hypothetical protein